MSRFLLALRAYSHCIIAFAISFTVYLVTTLLYAPADRLTGDEIFFYFQALHLRRFAWVWFEDTQPYLYPILLALSGSDDVTVLRIISSALMATASLAVGTLAERWSGRTGFWIAWMLFSLHQRSLQMATSLLTEPLFAILQALFFIQIDRMYVSAESHARQHIAIGLLLGAALLTRTVALLFLPSLLILFLLRRQRVPLEHYCYAAISAILVAMPYYGGAAQVFLAEKLAGNPADLHFNTSVITRELPRYFGIGVSTLLVLIAVRIPTSAAFKRQWPVFCFVFLTLVAIITVNRDFFPRHLFAIFVPVATLAAVLICHVRTSRARSALIFATMLFSSSSLVSGVRQSPYILSNNYFLSTDSVSAYSIPSFEIVAGPSEHRNISLPYFDQPNFTEVTYRAHFSTTFPYDAIMLNYVANAARVSLDGAALTDAPIASAYESIVLESPILPGLHQLDIAISSSNNICGLGQALLVTTTFLEREQTRARESRYDMM